MNLTQKLEKKFKDFSEQAPEEVKLEMKKAERELIEKEIGQKSLGVGDTFPEFNLLNQKNEKISLDDLLKTNKTLVISFYRGGWCPYCNLELKDLQDKIPALNKLNASLIAISPELPDESLSTAQKNALDFNILSDDKSLLAKELGISFELPENLKPLYEKFGIDIPKHNGENNFTLPIPATYIINEKKEITFSYKDIDYTKRLDPETVLNFLKGNE